MTSQHDKPKRLRREDTLMMTIFVPFGFLLSYPVGRDVGLWGYAIGPVLSLLLGLFVVRHVRC
jgi:hypothetical protein